MRKEFELVWEEMGGGGRREEGGKRTQMTTLMSKSKTIDVAWGSQNALDCTPREGKEDLQL